MNDTELDGIERFSRELEEKQIAREAVIKHRRDELFGAIDYLSSGVPDLDNLLREGKYDHERAYDMLKTMTARVAALKEIYADGGTPL